MYPLKRYEQKRPQNPKVGDLSAKENEALDCCRHFQFEDQEMKTLAGVYSPVQDISSSLCVSVLQGRLWALKARRDSKSSHSVHKRKQESPAFSLAFWVEKIKRAAVFSFCLRQYPFPRSHGHLSFLWKEMLPKGFCSSRVKSCAL